MNDLPANAPALGLRQAALVSEYDTEDNDVIAELYAPCLRLAETYDRAVGYFRANIYRELGEELLDFAMRGGKVRIVCSPDIPERDEDAARQGYELRGKRPASEQEITLVRVLAEMSKHPEEADCLDMLRILVERGSLDLYIATRRGGIFHRKIGKFTDSLGNFVVFAGSGNETENAVSSIEDWGNDEEFDVFRSWGEGFEQRKAQKKSQYLSQLFAGGTRHTKVRPLTEIERDALARFRQQSNLEGCRPGARQRSRRSKLESNISPYYYQSQAIHAWEKAGNVGMLSMATGTGKTITALLAAKPLIDQGVPTLIVVPSKVVFDQWLSELREIFPNVPILLAGAGNDWKADDTKRMYVSKMKLPRIVLATMDTASSDEFLEFFQQAERPLLIADEAHRLGSPGHRRILDLPFSAKLGLSATPERLFDLDGTVALERAFGTTPVFDLPLNGSVMLSEDSTQKVPVLGHFLSQYFYDFEPVDLTSEEKEKWEAITTKIKRSIARDPSQVQRGLLSSQSSPLRLLLIQRARIIKNAQAKIAISEKIISEKYPKDGRWIVYCDTEKQMNDVWDRLRTAHPYTQVLKYHSGMSAEERDRALSFFEKDPGIVVSIRCLDEGFNIPAADGAVILASSTNPREYIQRRGRVLRKSKGKWKAQIIDVLVLPQPVTEGDEIPLSIVRGELARAYKFASSALNVEVAHRLWRVCQEYGVRLESDLDLGMQEDEAEA